MSPFDPQKDIPGEFYSAKTFFTVGGSAAGVWIFCLVVGAIFPQHAITPLSYRIIAITLSEIIAIVMVLRLKSRKAENWFLSIFNGLLIFINASGWNVITANTFFSDKTNSDKTMLIDGAGKNIQTAGFLDSFHQIQWWQDNAVFRKNNALINENEQLKTAYNQLKNKPNSPANSNAVEISESVKKITASYDSLLLVLQARDLKIKELSFVHPNLKSQATGVVRQDTSITNKLSLIQSYGALMKNYQIQLNKCNEYNQELISKIVTLQRALTNCNGSNAN
jgi:hypothetical protein